MATITTRSGKGSPLTNTEVDDNFTNLNTAKYESGDTASLAALTLDNGQDAQVLQFNSGGTHRFNLWVQGTGEDYLEFRNSAGYSHIKLMDVNGVVINDLSDDLDFRVESNNNSYMLFVNAADDTVSIGTSANYQKLTVLGAIQAGSAAESTGGGAGLYMSYYGSNGDYIANFGAKNSSGGPALNYGVVFNSSGQMVATYDNFSGAKSSLANNGRDVKFWSTPADDQTASGSVITGGFNEYFSLGRNGFIFNEDSRDVDFRVESDGNTHMLFVDASANAVGIGTSTPSEALHINAGNLSVDGSVYRREYFSIPANSTRYFDVDITGSYGLYEVMVTGYGSSGSGNFFVHWTDGGHPGGNSYHRVNLISRSAQTNNPTLGELKKTSYGAYIKITNTSSTNSITCHCVTRSYNSSGVACTVRLLTTEPTAVQTINTFTVDEPSSRVYIGQDGAQNNAKVTVKSNATGQALSLQVQNDAYSLIQGWNAAGSNRFQVTGAGAITSFQGGAVFNENSDNASDFRVESDGQSHMLFVDASADRVGIRNDSPVAQLDVNGRIAARTGDSGTYNTGVLEITSSAANPQVKITTNIPYAGAGASTHAHTVKISGFNYGTSETCNLQICWHVYAGQFYARCASSSGGFAPTVTLAVENNYVVIHLGYVGYWPKLYVESLYNAFGGPGHAQNWTWSDAAVNPDANTPNQTVNYRTDLGGGNDIGSLGAVFNEHSGDQDFRVETDAATHAFFIDASAGRVGFFNSTPQAKVEITEAGGYSNANMLFLSRNETTRYNAYAGFGDQGGSNNFGWRFGTTNNNVAYDAMYIVDGKVGMNKSVPSSPLDVKGVSTLTGNENGGQSSSLADSCSYTTSTSSTDIFRIYGLSNSSAEITIIFRDASYRNGSFLQKLYISTDGSGTTVVATNLVVENKSRETNGTFPSHFTWTATPDGSWVVFAATADQTISGAGTIHVHVVSIPGNANSVSLDMLL